MVYKQAWSIKNYRYVWDVSISPFKLETMGDKYQNHKRKVCGMVKRKVVIQ
jgi:hypothetical protein